MSDTYIKLTIRNPPFMKKWKLKKYGRTNINKKKINK